MLSETELGKKSDELLAKGMREGHLTRKDILAVIPEEGDNIERIEALTNAVNEVGIPVIDLEEGLGEGEVTLLEPEELLLDQSVGSTPMLRRDTELVSDPVRMYLREIGRVLLISSEEEIRLARAIQGGFEASERLSDQRETVSTQERHPPELEVIQRGFEASERLSDPSESLSPQERRPLELKVMQGGIAQRRLAEANLRLVVSVAKRYVGRGMSFLDLIQEGNLGLLRAVEKFDFHKGYKFSTYATWWIRQAISRALADQARTIRIPVHMVESINRVARSTRELQQELGRDPTAEEIAVDMDRDGDIEAQVTEEPRINGLPLSPEAKLRLRRAAEKVRQIMNVSQEPMSLETPVGAEENSVLVDFIPDESVASPVDETNRELLREQMQDILSSLSQREREVLALRFGLKDGEARTLEEVGQQFGVTRERIRQIEAKALRKLRHPTRSRRLRDYLT